MKLYLSSYKIGNDVNKLKKMLPKNRKTAYISNALDCYDDFLRRTQSEQTELSELKSLGMEPEILDLKNYFGKKDELRKKLSLFGIIWVRGGNTFVLRQAMRLSGFDTIIKELSERDDIIYGGYSAGACILAPTLKGLDLMDDITEMPYKNSELIWEGLNIIDFSIVPHYDSEHPESSDAEKTVQYLKKHKIKYKTLRDGEEIITE
jgi:dipeptidase E